MIDISFIIPTINRDKQLNDTIDSIVEHIENIKEFEIIVVNDSKTNSPTIQYKDVILISNPNQGAASARNLGASIAKGDWLIFIDDDIIVTKEVINNTVTFIQNKKKCCYNPNWRYPEDLLTKLNKEKFGRFLINTGLINYEGWVKHANWNNSSIFQVDKLAAFFFVIPKDLFLKMNGFNEEFKNQSVEDDEFCLRLKNQGIEMFIDPTVYVYHCEYDRIDLSSRLNRLQTGARNKRQAFEMGIQEYKLKYSTIKKTIYFVGAPCKKLLLFLCKIIPNYKGFDVIYRRIVHFLIGIVIFNGYYLKK